MLVASTLAEPTLVPDDPVPCRNTDCPHNEHGTCPAPRSLRLEPDAICNRYSYVDLVRVLH